MKLEDWKNSNGYSHYQSLIKQDTENRKTIKRLSEIIKELKLNKSADIKPFVNWRDIVVGFVAGVFCTIIALAYVL